MRHLVLALALCVTCTALGAAQQPFAPGTLVRVQTVTGPLQVGTVASFSSDTLLFQPRSSAQARPIAAEHLRRVETSLGRAPRSRLARIGGLVGLAAGGVAAMALGQSCRGTGSHGAVCGTGPALGLVFGSGMIGAGIGAMAPPRQLWHTVMSPHVDLGPKLPHAPERSTLGI
jgi:hypothetical protein